MTHAVQSGHEFGYFHAADAQGVQGQAALGRHEAKDDERDMLPDEQAGQVGRSWADCTMSNLTRLADAPVID